MTEEEEEEEEEERNGGGFLGALESFLVRRKKVSDTICILVIWLLALRFVVSEANAMMTQLIYETS